MDAVVTVIAVVLALHVVVKFCFFALPYRFRRGQLDRSYRGRPRATQVSDPVSLALVVVLVVLLFVDGVAPPSFLIGLWVGATLVQNLLPPLPRPARPRARAACPEQPDQDDVVRHPGRAPTSMAGDDPVHRLQCPRPRRHRPRLSAGTLAHPAMSCDLQKPAVLGASSLAECVQRPTLAA